MIPVSAIIAKGLALYLYKRMKERLKINSPDKFSDATSVLIDGDSQNAVKAMVNAEEAINPIEVALRPFKTLAILAIFLCFPKKLNNNMENRVPNNIAPIVETSAPIMPAIFMPINVDIFIAKDPGVI